MLKDMQGAFPKMSNFPANSHTSRGNARSAHSSFLQNLVEISPKVLLKRRILWVVHFVFAAGLLVCYCILQSNISPAFQSSFGLSRGYDLEYIFPLFVCCASLASIPVSLYLYTSTKRWVIILDYASQLVLMVGYFFAGLASIAVLPFVTNTSL